MNKELKRALIYEMVCSELALFPLAAIVYRLDPTAISPAAQEEANVYIKSVVLHFGFMYEALGVTELPDINEYARIAALKSLEEIDQAVLNLCEKTANSIVDRTEFFGSNFPTTIQ